MKKIVLQYSWIPTILMSSLMVPPQENQVKSMKIPGGLFLLQSIQNTIFTGFNLNKIKKNPHIFIGLTSQLKSS